MFKASMELGSNYSKSFYDTSPNLNVMLKYLF